VRHEKKFRITTASFTEVKQVLNLHPLSFNTAFPDRWLNSLYFDSSDMMALNDNLNGISNRVKYRIRWYNETLVEAKKPILELKIRKNQFGSKEFKELADFNLSVPNEVRRISKDAVPESLRPVVITRYLRSYLISYNKKLRATIDREIHYYAMDEYQLLPLPHHEQAIILELKCEKEEVTLLREACQSLPFKISKNSKFVNGLSMVTY